MMPPPIGRKNDLDDGNYTLDYTRFNDAAPNRAEEHMRLVGLDRGGAGASMMPPPIGRKNLDGRPL